jgi:hypothetical protein
MSESTLSAFESYLEQTLASLPIRAGRRREIRDELLAHLLNVYEDELARHGDERKASAETLRRFGAADFLSTELESSIPVWERGLTWILGQKEKIMWRLFLVLGILSVLVGLGFVMPAVQEIVYHEVVTLSVVLLLFGAAVCGAGVWSFVHGIQRFRVRNV